MPGPFDAHPASRAGARFGEVPAHRVRVANEASVRADGDYVLYWMIAARRTTWSFGLQRATEWARALGRPLLVLEALRVDYPWASDRLHAFALAGMADNRRAFAEAGVACHTYVEPSVGQGRGLLVALANRACVVVTDDFPAFFLPRMVSAAAGRLPVSLEAVDGNGCLPLATAPKAFARAVDLRRYLQKALPEHLAAFPAPSPLAAVEGMPLAEVPDEVLRRWPAATDERLAGWVADLPIDHGVPPVAARGGPVAAAARLASFLDHGLERYAEDRNDPDANGPSGLSPWLHWGHVSAHEVVRGVLDREGWTPASLGKPPPGSREGWWGTSASAEGFLDQLVTWRELGHLWCARRDDADRYEGVPEWARASLAAHAGDPRNVLDYDTLEEARTGDVVWDAAQRQLRREGIIHNYLRMNWGKRVLEWSPTPEVAFSRLVALNDRWAIDGRDPNSYSGIGWVFGRFDRPWGPERPIFGTVRYMSSENTRRKLRMTRYLEEYGR